MIANSKRKIDRVSDYRLPKSDPLPPADSVQGYNAYPKETFRLAGIALMDWMINHVPFLSNSSTAPTENRQE